MYPTPQHNLTKEQEERFEETKRNHKCVIGELRDRGLFRCSNCRDEMKSFFASELSLARSELIKEIERFTPPEFDLSEAEKKASRFHEPFRTHELLKLFFNHINESLLHRIKEHHE